MKAGEPGREFDRRDPVRLDMSNERPRRQDKVPVRSTGLRQLPQPRCEVGEKTAVIERFARFFMPQRQAFVVLPTADMAGTIGH